MNEERGDRKVNKEVSGFLLSELPPSLLQVYQCLASLEYPIPDKESLRKQLKDGTDDALSLAVGQLILDAFEPTDFGLDSAQSALEKISRRQLFKAFFHGWQEKGNQIDQRLTLILRTMRDVRRIGVGGSDLGTS